MLLDGPDLTELLARAGQLGGRVVRAQRLRKGLLMRQWYEVTVAVPDPQVAPPTRLAARRAPAPARPVAPPAGIGDLLGAAEAAERMESEASRAARAAGARSAKSQRGR
ncbi:hypothetical protein [Georgenia satyanarayanai]|uniref:hypothetical protein n=1 Tax=Georgenia satyanarayanai TaxID=860221 RepID=UPI000DA24A40|nr:hypothetical protein [Georgenia satyanarayanai]